MTFLERITYLTGRYLQVFQYMLFNAYRVVGFSEGAKRLTAQTNTEENILAIESKARADLVSSQGKGDEQLLSELLGKGIAVKDEKELKALLLKRSYVSNYFYVDSANALAREDPVIYESKITELNDYVDRAVKLNQSLIDATEKIVDRAYRKRS